MDVALAFVQVSQQVVVEVDGPAAVGNFFEADVFPDQGRGDGDEAAVEADSAVGADVAREVVTRVFGTRNTTREDAAGRPVDRGGRLALQSFMADGRNRRARMAALVRVSAITEALLYPDMTPGAATRLDKDALVDELSDLLERYSA